MDDSQNTFPQVFQHHFIKQPDVQQQLQATEWLTLYYNPSTQEQVLYLVGDLTTLHLMTSNNQFIIRSNTGVEIG